MIEVFRESGFPVEVRVRAGIDSRRAARPRSARRRWSGSRTEIEVAAAAAVSRFFEPRSVAVIGASRERDTVGGQIFHNLLDGGFEGVAYPVNREAEVVQSVRAYSSVGEIPGPIDLAVIAVPAAAVIEVVRECAGRGSRPWS